MIVVSTDRNRRTRRICACLSVVLISGGLLIPTTVSANNMDRWIQAAESGRLDAEETWLKLVHYQAEDDSASGFRSIVINPEFFLAEDGRDDPAAELRATLSAFTALLPEDVNNHAQCKFPARYLWLEEQLAFTPDDIPKVGCPLYDKWTVNDTVESISVIFATGYLANPASYYGHILIKFNSSADNRTSGLIDESLNYGAIVPDGVDPVSYVINGVFGGYEGGFSHIGFYHHNHNYVDIELRDVWEYELDLSPRDVKLITAHSWELLGKKFDYYFFRRNCAFRMAELLELTEDTQFIPLRRFWTIPQTLVQQIARSSVNGRQLLKKLYYHPSRQSSFFTRFESLGKREREVARLIVEDESLLDAAGFRDLPDSSQARIADTLIDYYQFALDPRGPADDPLVQRYNKLLQLRFKLLPGDTLPVTSIPKGPHLGRDPSMVRFGALHSSRFGDGAVIQVRPGYYDDLDGDAGHIPNSALKMGDTDIRLVDGSLYLNRLDFFTVQSVRTGISGFPADKGKTWSLRFAMEQQDLSCRSCLVMRFTGVYGKVARLGDNLVFGTAFGGGLQNREAEYGTTYGRVKAFINYRVSPRFRMQASTEFRDYFTGNNDEVNLVDLTARYSLSDDWDIRLVYSKNVAEETSLSFSYYW